MADQIEFVLGNLGNLLIGFPKNRPGGLLMTLMLTFGGLSIGLLIALVIGSAQASRLAPIRWIGLTYSRIIRGVPLVLLLLIIHQLLNGWRQNGTSSIVSALVTLVLYASAYQSDIIASGIRAVPKSLIEDARTMGATPTSAYLDVTLPYGFRVIRPALLTQAITVFKDSSVVVILGVADLTTTARIVLGADVGRAPYWLATYLTVGAIYFAVAFAASRWVRGLERNDRTSGLVETTGLAS